jgi:hypothetical protein
MDGGARSREARTRQVRRPSRGDTFTNDVAVDVVHGPVVAAAMEYLHWTSLVESLVNVLVIGLAALIVAVAVVPIEAAPYRFGG